MASSAPNGSSISTIFGLEDDADAAMRLRHRSSVDAYLPRARRQQAGDHLQKRGLAAARRPDDDEKLALVNGEIDRPQ
jgi:hypothetical protein